MTKKIIFFIKNIEFVCKKMYIIGEQTSKCSNNHKKKETTMIQKLLTAAIKSKAKKFPLSSQDGKKGQALVLARFFTPASCFTWYVLELDPQTGDAFGYILGHEAEYGYFNVNELQATKQNCTFMGRSFQVHAVERDICVDPAQRTLEELLDAHNEEKPSWWKKESA